MPRLKKLTEGVLRERFGFQDNDFIIIKDATHTGIEKAFNALTERVKSDDFVYIYYSGHGSQTDDLNGDEPSGLDQTWVSYGARTSDEAHKDNSMPPSLRINARNRGIRSPRFILGVGSPKLKFGLLNTLTKVALTKTTTMSWMMKLMLGWQNCMQKQKKSYLSRILVTLPP